MRVTEITPKVVRKFSLVVTEEELSIMWTALSPPQKDLITEAEGHEHDSAYAHAVLPGLEALRADSRALYKLWEAVNNALDPKQR